MIATRIRRSSHWSTAPDAPPALRRDPPHRAEPRSPHPTRRPEPAAAGRHSRTARVVPVGAPVLGQQAHRRVRRRDHLGAVGALEARAVRAARPSPQGRHPATEPARRETHGGRERSAVEARDGAQQRVLLLTGHRLRQLAQPSALAVARAPHLHPPRADRAAGRRAGTCRSTCPAGTAPVRRAT